MRYDFKKYLLKVLPYTTLLLFNSIIDLLYAGKKNVYVPFDLLVIVCFTFFLSEKLKNKYNRIMSQGWLAFFLLGIININSVSHQTNMWNLDIEGASYLYFYCMISFNLSLLFFENFSLTQNNTVVFKDDLSEMTNSPFSYSMYIFPVLMFLDMFNHLGFIPIISGMDIVDEMYIYNYGSLYGFKFICIYGFLSALLAVVFSKKKYLAIIYICILFFIISVDGKRFVFLLCLIALIPAYTWMIKMKGREMSNKPIVFSFLIVGLIYIFMSILRAGGNLDNIFLTVIDKIPFGVEYKDFVHSFNDFESGKIKGYNFELSALGSFLNSSLLNLLGYNKEELVHMGSAYTWMKLYNIDLGIRTGIVSELYFAYSYMAIPLMSIIAFATNKISVKLLSPSSYFNLFQNSVLFALFFLLINGQATVFFGCLPMVIYIYIFYKIIKWKKKGKRVANINDELYTPNQGNDNL
jgi:hypothetical protein